MEIGWDEILLDDPNSKGIFEMELEDMARPVDETEMDMDEVINFLVGYIGFLLFNFIFFSFFFLDMVNPSVDNSLIVLNQLW